jgi:hypothetical protein
MEPMTREIPFIEKQWREITSRNPITGSQFNTGLKDFKFSVGQGYGFIPSESYFRVQLKLTIGTANPLVQRVPIRTDGVTFAEGCVGNMFNNIYFNMGGQTVSSLTTGVGQCEVLSNRLRKTKAHNDTIGKVTGFVPHWNDRLVMTTIPAEGKEELEDYNTSSTQGRNQRMFIWRPALGIFDHSKPLGAGEYDIQLNPSQDYILSALQSTLGDVTKVAGIGDGQVNIEVEEFRFYACMVRTNVASTGNDVLVLHEMSVHTVNASGDSEINEEVSVPSSTRALSVFLQDGRAGKHSGIPPSKFHVAEDEDSALGLRSYQIQYANITKPVTRYSSDHTATVDTLQQRYVNCALESGMFFNPAGFESYEQYLERGPILHESFIKAADNLATRVQIVAQYNNITAASRLHIVSHYTSVVTITRSNGLIVNVTQQNT